MTESLGWTTGSIVYTPDALMKLRCFFSLVFAIGCCWKLTAQCASGIVVQAHANPAYNSLFDPYGDGYITESGSAFTSGTTERDEFELLPNSVTGWVKLVDVSETSGDTQTGGTCNNPDLTTDDDGGDFG